MNNRAWLILFLFLIWTAGSGYWYVCEIKGLCESEGTSKPAPISPEKEVFNPKFPLNFVQSDPKIVKGPEWMNQYEMLMAKDDGKKKLNIVGPYLKTETNPTKYENIGLARAEAVKRLVMESISEDRITTSSKLINDKQVKSHGPYFDASSFVTWVISNDFVKEVEGKTMIYFPYNSNKEIKTPEIVEYMNDLAEQLKSNPEQTLRITGHTDSDGSAITNEKLGLERANQIKKALNQKGVSNDRIHATSRGEEEPIADNSTEEGKKLNRRTEIIVNK